MTPEEIIKELENWTGYRIELYTNPFKYYKRFREVFGDQFYELTDSGYPTPLAMGWCSHKYDEIGLFKVFNWQQRLAHELGHVFKFEHTMERGHIMHPWGFCRGWKGADEFLTPEMVEGLRND